MHGPLHFRVAEGVLLVQVRSQVRVQFGEQLQTHPPQTDGFWHAAKHFACAAPSR